MSGRLETKSNRCVRLKAVATGNNQTDYYLEVASQDKYETQNSMRRQFGERFEMELEKINQSVGRKGGVKKTDKVHQRIGRARQKYPSVQHYYDIEVKTSQDGLTATEILWSKNEQKYEQKENAMGIYFLKNRLPHR